MTTPNPAVPNAELKCAQCGGVLHPDEGQIFLNCPYCGSSVYVDKSQVVFHWALGCTLTPEAAAANLRRWMAGNQTVKDLDRKARVTSTTFQYFPVWYCKTRHSDGKEKVSLELGAATSISEIKALEIPAGDLKKYEPALDAQAVAPSVPFPSALERLRMRGVLGGTVREAALVHLPVYIYKYEFGGRSYTALVEGASGKVFANLFPAKAEAPYFAVAALSTAGFLCTSSFPAIGYLTSQRAGMWVGLAACLLAGALFAAVVFALAAWVSAKV